MLGAINTVLAIGFFSVLALMVYRVKSFVETNENFVKWQETVTSCLFILLGIVVIFI